MDTGANGEIDEVLAGLGASGSGAAAGQQGSGGGVQGHSAGGTGAAVDGSPAQGQQIIQYQPPRSVLGARASTGVAGGVGTGAGMSDAAPVCALPGAEAAPDTLADYFVHQFSSMLTPQQPGASSTAGPGPTAGAEGLDAFSSAFDKMQLHPAAMAPQVCPQACKADGRALAQWPNCALQP